MTPFQALILGLDQALAEFLPISSSAHLVILPHLLGWEIQSLFFDLVLHLGTLFALLFVFGNDFYKVIMSLLNDLRTKKLDILNYATDSKLGIYILIAMIPAVVAGLLLEPYIEKDLRRIELVIIFLLFGTLLLFIADTYSNKIKSTKPITAYKALVIGLFQVLALFPGVSRSGSTISAGILSGLNRVEAARFSFMLSAPMVLAAASFELVKNLDKVASFPPILFIVGLVSSFIGGIIVIKFLLKFLNTHSLRIFIVYRLILVLVLIYLS